MNPLGLIAISLAVTLVACAINIGDGTIEQTDTTEQDTEIVIGVQRDAK